VATNGDDSADGLSLETPWRTIQKSADTMVAGDTVQIRGGTYIERILPRNGGSEGMPITYQAYLDEEVVIQGKNISKWDSCIRIYSLSAKDVNYITLKNLILDGSYNSDSTDWGVCGSGVSICGVPDNPIHDIVMTGITCRNLFRGIALENFVDNCTVSSCNISESQWGIITTGSNAPYNLVIHDNRISNGVLQRESSGHFRGNGITLTEPSGISDYYMKITNNEVNYQITKGISTGSTNNVLIKDNWSHHNGATGIQLHGQASPLAYGDNIVVQDNLCEWNGQNYPGETGIWVYYNRDVLISGNIIRHNELGLRIESSSNVVARNNAIYDNQSTQTSWSGGILLVGSREGFASGDTVMVHNTVHKNGTEDLDLGRLGHVSINYTASGNEISDNNLFKNNIISERKKNEASGSDIDLWIEFDEIGGPTNVLNYNTYYHSQRNIPNVVRQKVPTIWTHYQSDSGQNANSITSDPMYVSYDPNDPIGAIFALGEESPCIDAGGHLTFAENSGTNTTLLDVNDARYFCDGYGLIEGDWIQVNDNIAQVIDVNDVSDTLTLDRTLSWNSGDPVSYPYAGVSPDIGAFEYGVLNVQQQRWSTSIQAAIDEAADGEEIVVNPGTYTEQIDFLGKAITLRSVDPNDWAIVAATIIDANDTESGIGVTFTSEEGVDSVLRGLTIRGGTGGIEIIGSSASPRIERCTIEANSDSGILCSASTPLVTGCIIRDHTANNDSSGIYSAKRSTPYIANNWIYGNTRGIRLSNSNGLVYNNTLANNQIGVWADRKSSPVVNNCILWNEKDDLYGCTASFSCIKDGDDGLGNLFADPAFVASAEGDYHLQAGSACINAGDNETVLAADRDVDGDERIACGDEDGIATVDMGADEFVCQQGESL
jgi:parallel beta-helix repeat protein